MKNYLNTIWNVCVCERGERMYVKGPERIMVCTAPHKSHSGFIIVPVSFSVGAHRTLVFIDMFITVRASRVSVSTLAALKLRRGAVLKRFNSSTRGTQCTHTHTHTVHTNQQMISSAASRGTTRDQCCLLSNTQNRCKTHSPCLLPYRPVFTAILMQGLKNMPSILTMHFAPHRVET